MDSPAAPAPEKVFYTREGRNLCGPFTRAELAGQIRAGTLREDDLVQIEGLPLWRPVRHILGDEPLPEPDAAAPPMLALGQELPEWPDLFSLVGQKLWGEFENPSLQVMGTFLAIAAVAVLCLRLPILFWLPWLAFALVGAVLFLLERRILPGLALSLGALAIPWFLLPESPTPPRSVSVAEPPPVAVVTPTPAPLPVAPPPPAPVALPAPAPPPEPVAVIPPVAPPAPEPPRATPVPPAARAPVVAVPTATPVYARPFSLNSPPLPAPSIPTPPTFSGDFVQEHNGALVVVKDEHGSGSGFIATLGGQPYLFTNIHVAAGLQRAEFTLVDGTRLQPVTAEAAAGHDIMRFTLKTPPRQSLPASSEVSNEVHVGDAVLVLGNSGGGGVVTSLPGKVVGLGPDRLEVSSEFIPGNSGSPIIHVPTGEVIGIATYLTRRHEEFSGAQGGGAPPPSDGNIVVRRFGYRLDSVHTWEPVNWAVFRAEAEQLHQVSNLSEDIFNFLDALRKRREPSFATDALRRPATEWRNKVSRAHIAEPDRLAATQSFLSTLRYLAHNDVSALQGRLHYSYFRDELTREREVRDRMYKAFDDESRQLAMPSTRGF